MTTAIYNRLTAIILTLLLALTLPFEFTAVKKWTVEHANLNIMFSLLRAVVAFTCLYFGIFIRLYQKNSKEQFQGAGAFIFAGAVFSAISLIEAAFSAYFVHNISTILLSPVAMTKVQNIMTAANIHLIVLAVLFGAIGGCFAIMLKKINRNNATEQKNRGDGE